MIHIYNTATKRKEPFKPIIPQKVSLYVCGITAYDYCHIGHGRVFVVFDMVVRYLRLCGYAVRYVRNITDIDDKIIQRAKEVGSSIDALTDRFIAAAREDEAALGVLPPDATPRVRDLMPQVIALIQILMDKGYAYVAENGDVCYAIDQCKDYGRFAHQSVDKLRKGVRVDILAGKKDPLDFVLWKLAKSGEPFWDSPWGRGRPGWHIECSSMVYTCLGKSIDIHGGGVDLVFPHHQNEIAQSEGAFDGCFAHNWMHVGHVQVNAQKMSKSLQNFFLIRDVLQKYEVEVVRYFMLASHYRSPINYSHDNLESAKAGLARLYTSMRGLCIPPTRDFAPSTWLQCFHAAMADDFNTPVALAVLFDLARDINKQRDDNNHDKAAQLGSLLKYLGSPFGILQKDPEQFLQAGISDTRRAEIDRLMDARRMARESKNWQEADRIRGVLSDMGVVLEDTPEGTIVRGV